jgi:hypothetical protein
MEAPGRLNTELAEPRHWSRQPTKWHLVLSTMGLTAVGIAQPILDLLGRSPDFFIARAATGGDVMLLGIVLGLAAPLVLGVLVLLAHLIRPTAGRVIHVLIFTVMGALIAISLIRLSPIDQEPWVVAIGIALLFGSLFCWSYYRFEWMRSFLNVVAVAPLVVTVVFLFFSPTSEVAWGMGPATGSQSAPVGNPAPLVMLVFDEFPIASVIDTEGQIQEDYFPALAELSNDATWFRNAVGTQQATRDAMPTLLTGISRVPGEKLPHYADHPSSIFTLLGNDYEIDAIETLTQICPAVVCSEGSRDVGDFEDRWASLSTDLSIVTGHLLLPGALSSDLPPIDQNWGNFAPASVERPDKWSIHDRMQGQLQADRRTEVERFLAGLEEPLEPTEFHFIHLPLPHRPWMYTPDGRTYAARPGFPGAERHGWGRNDFLVEQAYQRHLIQTQYVDSIIGSVIGKLAESGSYDSSIIVITADHGVAVRPNQHQRSVQDETVGDIAAVPLFIKAPHQSRGVVDDYRALVTDIVPTIAGLVDAQIPWAVDGIDLFGTNRPERLESVMMGQARTVTFDVDGDEKVRVVSYHSAYFGDRGPFGLAPLGYEGLRGATVDVVSDSGNLVTAKLDFPELYTDVDLESDLLPILLSGMLDGPLSPNDVLAVTIDSRIVALTETWDDDGIMRFQAMLPPSILKPGENEFALYAVHHDGKDSSYSLVEQP